jgi:glycosyltransferase involved in cell wall biosynthesis
MSAWHKITFLSFIDSTDTKPDIASLRKYCEDIQFVPWKRYEPDSRRARLGYLSPIPRSVIDTFSLEMAQKIKELVSKNKYDLIIASQTTMAGYASYFSGLPAVFEEIEVGVYYQQYARTIKPWHRIRYGLTWTKHRYYLSHLLHHFRTCTVVSEFELLLLNKAVHHTNSIEVIPNSLYLEDYQEAYGNHQPNTLIFTGSFKYFANYDAMTWFLKEVFPLIQSKMPDVHLTITGDNVGFKLPTTENVKLTGYVVDVLPLIASSWVSIAPIRMGGGTRLKILESMALQTPVVATSKGVEGLDVQNEVHLLIADKPSDYAEAIIRLMKEPGLYQRLVDNAYQLLRERYDWAVVMPLFLNLIERAAQS